LTGRSRKWILGSVAQYIFCDIYLGRIQIWSLSGHSSFRHTSPMQRSYAHRVRACLDLKDREIFRSLSSPSRVQDFLDSLPINFELAGETSYSPVDVLRHRTAHCFEGAVFAAAALAFHGHIPLLMDFATRYDDEDHTVTLFRRRGLWGALSKTNHPILRYRDPIYRTPRELAMSYVHEYFMHDGRKSLVAYSQPYDLGKFDPEEWVSSTGSLDWLMRRLAKSRYFGIAPDSSLKSLRRVSDAEIRVLDIEEWPRS